MCSHCLSSQKVNVSENQCLIGTGSDNNDETEVLNTENELIKKIEQVKANITSKNWTDLSQNVKNKLCEFSNILESIIKKDLYDDGLKLSQEYKNVVLLKSTKCPTWLSERNNLLVSFLKGATEICAKGETDKKVNALTHAVEQVYYAQNLNIITPFAFKRNLITFSLTHSKLALKLYWKWESFGSYSALSEILLQPGEPLTCKINSVINTINNNQKVGKCGRQVKEGGEVPISICSTLDHINVKPESGLQKDELLVPKNWLSTKKRIDLLEEKATADFRLYRGSYIFEMLNKIVKEQIETDERFGLHDYVDISISNEAKSCICSICFKTFSKNKTECPSCSVDTKNFDGDYDPYYRTPSCHPHEKPTMQVGEPCMVNPSSHEAMDEVMSHVKKCCNVGPHCERKRTILASDGVPYILASDIQDNFYICNNCNIEVDRKNITDEEFNEYIQVHCQSCKQSNGTEAEQFSKRHQDILLLPGPGHMELNEGKMLLKFLWYPFVSYLSTLLGFRTPRAKDVVKEGVNHHRTKQIFSVCLEALSKELLLPFA